MTENFLRLPKKKILTFKLEPKHRITSALSACLQAVSQFKGHCSFPRSPKCTMVSNNGLPHL